VRGDVGAPAVVEVAADGVVVVAVDRRDVALLDEPADLAGVRAVADQVPAAVDDVDANRVDRGQARLQGGQVAVYVGDNGDAVHD
jgi:hypothetical protein